VTDESAEHPAQAVDPKPLLVTPRRKFHMGHKDGPMPVGTLSTKHLFGAAARLAASADLSACVDQVRDQGQTSQCVGMALARILHIQAQVQKFGSPNPGAMPYPSSQGIYDLARQEDDQDPLVDEGSVPGSALTALQADVGVPLDRDWPIDPSKINQAMPTDLLARALVMKVSGAYTIESDGASRSDDCAQALINNHAISIAIQVGDSYENCNSATDIVTAVPQGGAVYGGHDISIVGFRTVNGRRQWLNVGSWGTGWGFGGYAWLDDGVITAPTTSALIVTTVVPDFSLSAAMRQKIATLEPKKKVT
jgi:hypothetical protein